MKEKFTMTIELDEKYHEKNNKIYDEGINWSRLHYYVVEHEYVKEFNTTTLILQDDDYEYLNSNWKNMLNEVEKQIDEEYKRL